MTRLPLHFAATGAILFAIGLAAAVARSHLLRTIIALNVMGSGVFLFLVALAAGATRPFPDPVPHAMVLTGIVVAVSSTAVALSLARRLERETGRPRLDYLDRSDERGG
jgi:multicomponent Na+:H+ antiporter subunit C